MQPRREEPSGNTVNEKSQNRTTKMKTHIIITDAKESERFPGKNQILLGHTVDWLAGEADDTMEFWYVSREDEIFPEGRIDLGNCHILFAPKNKKYDDHKSLLEWAEAEIDGKPNDKYVLLQLTQPVRRKGLLQDALGASTKDNVVVSYVQWVDEHWRIVDKGTLEYIGGRDKEKPHRLFDGSIYVWQNGAGKIFDLPNQKKAWVANGTMPVCDIDRPWQYHGAYLEGLKELCNENERIYD